MNDEKKTKKEKRAGGDNPVKGTFRAYKSEFSKIVWPSRSTLFKHTVTVIVVSLMFGVYIALNDFIFGQVFQAFVQWVA
ncbi:MAG: preprotein translocase subunit SecE [Defluviitaleaceae bacterium]|nr:preprotein translocase subunit SecE [Defluviitaleaceae bacterium]